MKSNIPEELKGYRQWVVWKEVPKEGGKVTKVPYSPKTGNRASVTNPDHWSDYNSALEVSRFYSGIGFVLTREDPYVCIDLDEVDDPEIISRQQDIFKILDSYSEVSPSGKGLHIFVKGSVPEGRREKGVEIYPHERYVTMTGDVFHEAPIREVNGELVSMWEAVGSKRKDIHATTVDVQPNGLTDEQVIESASRAMNGTKFELAYHGKWEEGGYPSASESDFTLVNILYFHSKDKAQVARIFKASPAGNREKYRTSKSDYHLNRMLSRCSDMDVAKIDISAMQEAFKRKVNTLDQIEEIDAPEPSEADSGYTSSEDEEYRQIDEYFPAGLVGEIAQYIYDSAPRPVKQIALSGAIGIMAGICGRAFNVSRTGLNMYVMLVADTGRGKEAISTGIDSLIQACLERGATSAREFRGPSDIASKQAIVKHFSRSRSKSFTVIMSEFGLFLQQLSTPNPNSNTLGLKQAFLDLYHKSGSNSILGESIYSDVANSTQQVKSPAMSLIGESTGVEFYRGLNERMVTSGLLPRCLVIEYKGNRVPFNEKCSEVKPSNDLITNLSTLMQNSLRLNEQDKHIDVEFENAARVLFSEFDAECDDLINEARRNDVVANLWNRAHLKAMKLASIIAVGKNYINPSIDAGVANYAIKVVKREIRDLILHFENGDVGHEDKFSIANNQGLVIQAIISWFKMTPTDIMNKTNSIKNKIYRQEGFVPHRHIQQKVGTRCSSDLLRRTLDEMIKGGLIVKMTQQDQMKIFQVHQNEIRVGCVGDWYLPTEEFPFDR